MPTKEKEFSENVAGMLQNHLHMKDETESIIRNYRKMLQLLQDKGDPEVKSEVEEALVWGMRRDKINIIERAIAGGEGVADNLKEANGIYANTMRTTADMRKTRALEQQNEEQKRQREAAERNVELLQSSLPMKAIATLSKEHTNTLIVIASSIKSAETAAQLELLKAAQAKVDVAVTSIGKVEGDAQVGDEVKGDKNVG